MATKPQNNFLKPTNIFMIVGIFIPGFTAIGIIGLQSLISLLGVECGKSWNILWTITTIASFILPIAFIMYLKKTTAIIKRIKFWLTFFNIFEYLFIQATLGMFFTNGKTLCYVIDGQNGIEFVFTAWAALPIIYLFSLLFKRVLAANKLVAS